MKNKQVLDIKQMRHLQKLGMELKETMLYWVVYEAGHENNFVTTKENAMEVIDESCGMLPAYTLQDVLDALPKFYHIANIGWTKLSIRVHTTKEWEIGYVYTDELSKYAYGCRILGKELIDAAYELFCWCVEMGFVETNKNE